MHSVESIASYGPVTILMQGSMLGDDLSKKINSKRILGIVKKRYGIKSLNNIFELYNYKAALEYDLDDVVMSLLPMEGTNLVKHKDGYGCSSEDEALPNDLIPCLLALSLVRGSYKIALALIPRACRELKKVGDAYDDLEDFSAYLELFLVDLLESGNEDIYEAFFGEIDDLGIDLEAVLGCIVGYDDVRKTTHFSLAHALMTKDYGAFNIINEYAPVEDVDRVSMSDILEVTRSKKFKDWLIKKKLYTVGMDAINTRVDNSFVRIPALYDRVIERTR